eukprot:Skav218317  [mRNA]  locus=scaffold2239:76240:79704:+ [translate_table: standard]
MPDSQRRARAARAKAAKAPPPRVTAPPRAATEAPRRPRFENFFFDEDDEASPKQPGPGPGASSPASHTNATQRVVAVVALQAALWQAFSARNNTEFSAREQRFRVAPKRIGLAAALGGDDSRGDRPWLRRLWEAPPAVATGRGAASPSPDPEERRKRAERRASG